MVFGLERGAVGIVDVWMLRLILEHRERGLILL